MLDAPSVRRLVRLSAPGLADAIRVIRAIRGQHHRAHGTSSSELHSPRPMHAPPHAERTRNRTGGHRANRDKPLLRALRCLLFKDPSHVTITLQSNDPAHRPRASDVQLETTAQSRGSVQPVCWTFSLSVAIPSQDARHSPSTCSAGHAEG